MWSSWFFGREDSRRCLVDPCAATIHACFFLNRVGLTPSPFSFLKRARWVLFWPCPFFARHCRLHRNFQFYPRIFDGFFVFSIIRINKVNAFNLRALSSFGFSIAHSCFSLLNGFSNLGPYFRQHVLRSGSCLNFCQLLPGPHVSLGGCSFNREHFVNSFHGSDKLLFGSTFQESSTRFSCMTSRSVRVDLVTSMCFSGIGNVSSYGTLSCSLWWRWMKSPWIDQKSARASASCVFLQVETLPSRHEVFHWKLRSFRFVSDLEWVLRIHGLFRTFFAGQSAIGKIKLSPFLWRQCFFCVGPSSMDFWRVNLLHISSNAYPRIHHLFVLSILLSRWFFEDKFLMRPTFPNLPDLLSEYPLSKFTPRLMHTRGIFQVKLSGLVSCRNRMIFNHCSKRNC